MAVPVGVTDGDESEPRAQAVIEALALIGGAVVSDLDHVDRPDRAGRAQRILLRLAEVAEEERTEPTPLRVHHEAAGVPTELRAAGRGCGRPDDLP